MKKLLVVLILLVGGVWFYGRSLPRNHVVKSTVVLGTAGQDTVWKVIRAIGAQPTWWSDVKQVRPILGRRRETWEQNMGGATGLITVEVTSVVDGERLVTTIVPNDVEKPEEMAWGGKWSYRVYQSASGTTVQIIEEGWVDPPFFRVMMKLSGTYRTIDSYLSSLAAHFGEMATPRHGT